MIWCAIGIATPLIILVIIARRVVRKRKLRAPKELHVIRFEKENRNQ